MALLSIELVMILLEPHLPFGRYQYDPDLGFRIRPYANGTNRFGFNDRDYPLQKQPGVFRILAVGDSFNWAGGKDRNYTAVLEELFQERFGRGRVEVVNAGYPMTHTVEQLAMLKKYGIQYNPDLVFLGFFMGNDFINGTPGRKQIILNGAHFTIEKGHELRFLGYPIVPASRLLTLLKQKIQVFRGLATPRILAMMRSPDSREDTGTFTLERFLDIEKTRLEFFSKENHESNRYKGEIDYILRGIDDMHQFLQHRDIRLVVGIFPDEFQVDDSLLSRILSTYRLDREAYDMELGQRILKGHLRSRHVPFIDLLSEFRAEGRDRRLYLKTNTHWNDAGNELAARIIFADLSRSIDQ